ncbi:MAG: leucine-rich repeat domain-containing protein [Clostridia bacterium]|nr:leucine-rich repeat domain-containing protein [Clostridia bacterium]
MSVQSKMTAIASGLRTLSGTENKMGLDAMNSHVADANDTVDTQTGLISQIKSALHGKAAAREERPGQEKDFNTEKNGVFTVEPDEGYVLTKVTMAVDVPEEKPEQTKTVDITNNGTVNIAPDAGKTLSGVTVNVNVPTGGGSGSDDGMLAAVLSRTVTSLNVPAGTAKLGLYALRNCDMMTAVTLPEGLTAIEGSAFYNCTSLGNIEIPSTVTLVDSQVFYNCTALSTVTFKGKPATIYYNAFNRCTALTDIYVPWAEGEVAEAPWGATSAKIHYNSEV